MHMSTWTSRLLLLAAVCAFHVTAFRHTGIRVDSQGMVKDNLDTEARSQNVAAEGMVKDNLDTEARSQDVAAEGMVTDNLDIETRSQNAVADPKEEGYWSTHKGSGNLIGLVNDADTQKFLMKQDVDREKQWRGEIALSKTFLKYDFYSNADSGVDLASWDEEKKKSMKVLRVVPEFTMHGHQSAEFTEDIGNYQMFSPHVVNLRTTCQVAKSDSPKGTVLFTIQKRLLDDHCDGFFGLVGCKAVLKIFVGNKGDRSTLIYYGVQDVDGGEPDFKFYHSKDSYMNNKEQWVAQVYHKKTRPRYWRVHGTGEATRGWRPPPFGCHLPRQVSEPGG